MSAARSSSTIDAVLSAGGATSGVGVVNGGLSVSGFGTLPVFGVTFADAAESTEVIPARFVALTVNFHVRDELRPVTMHDVAERVIVVHVRSASLPEVAWSRAVTV